MTLVGCALESVESADLVAGGFFHRLLGHGSRGGQLGRLKVIQGRIEP